MRRGQVVPDGLDRGRRRERRLLHHQPGLPDFPHVQRARPATARAAQLRAASCQWGTRHRLVVCSRGDADPLPRLGTRSSAPLPARGGRGCRSARGDRADPWCRRAAGGTAVGGSRSVAHGGAARGPLPGRAGAGAMARGRSAGTTNVCWPAARPRSVARCPSRRPSHRRFPCWTRSAARGELSLTSGSSLPNRPTPRRGAGGSRPAA